MNIEISEELDPICETLALLYMSQNYEKIKKVNIDQLNQLGINGDLFIKKTLKVLDKYINTFNKYKIIDESIDHFSIKEDDVFAFIALSFVLVNNKHLMNSINDISQDDLRDLILKSYNNTTTEEVALDSINTLNDIIEFLKTTPFTEDTKWKLTIILNNPKTYYSSLIKIVENNLNAYNEAFKSIEKPHSKLMSQFTKYINSGKCELITNNYINYENTVSITPVLAYGSCLFAFENSLYLGLLFETIHNEHVNSMGSKGDIVLKLKALSDKSKLEIVSILKNGPKYSQEIAAMLELTPATVSYHMSVLLECCIVSIEKKDGKVYYSLNTTTLQNFLNELNNTLL
ncbi:MAG: metalloregulator ArsR/SmtB family transcription factor [Erysipelotrichales bacterium]